MIHYIYYTIILKYVVIITCFKELSDQEILREIKAVGQKYGAVLRKSLQNFPCLQKKEVRVFRRFILQEKSMMDFREYIEDARTVMNDDKISPMFAILSGGPGTGKTRLLEELAEFACAKFKKIVPIPITFNSVSNLDRSKETNLEFAVGLRLVMSYLFCKFPETVTGMYDGLSDNLKSALNIRKAMEIITTDIGNTLHNEEEQSKQIKPRKTI